MLSTHQARVLVTMLSRMTKKQIVETLERLPVDQLEALGSVAVSVVSPRPASETPTKAEGDK